MTMLTWLADVLRSAGLTVIEESGWETRGHGEMEDVKGVLCHHTAGPTTGDDPSLGVVLNGRSDLAGPLAQLFLSRSGTFHVVAAGVCYHAGAGAWHGVTQGNHQLIGVEAENAGTGKDPWPDIQMQAYEKGVAALLKYLHEDDMWAIGHKEYALPKGRKVDPSFDMITFREAVAADMGGETTLPIPSQTNPAHSMLRKGDQGSSVEFLQEKLGVSPLDGRFGPQTEAAVKAYQQGHGLTVDGLVGPKTWTSLGE